ncbi:MAG TPA: TonB family protein [Puia sp.]
MSLLFYLLKTVLISGLLLGYYWLFLRNKSFHRYNRYFLMGIPVISLILPGLRFNLPQFWGQNPGNNPIHLLGVANGGLEEAVTVYARQGHWKGLPWESLCLALAMLFSLVFLFRFYRSLRLIYILRRRHPFFESQGARIYLVRQEGTPFSFFKNIFWNESKELNSPQGRQILRHELYHVQHKHSLDIVLLEIARIVFWFNPFIHLIRLEIQAIHEFLADAYAASETDRLEYAELLLVNSIRPKSISITHPFFQNPIKRRIVMITTNKNIRSGLLRRMMILPVIALLLGLFAFKLQNHSLLFPAKTKNVRVVIDAGHGGIYTGAQANGVFEKDINLQIAKKIQELAKDYQVEVVMSRDGDRLPEQFKNLREDLLYRTALPARTNADLLVSIHLNSADKSGDHPAGGFDIYVPGNNSGVYPGSVKLGSGISEFIKKDYSISPELKQARILELDNATVPSVLIECGYIENKTDLDFITNDKNQEAIARDILEGIRQYSQDKSSMQDDPAASRTDTLVADTMTIEALRSSDPNTIYSINVDKKNNRIYVKFKNGKENVVLVTKEVKMVLDTGGAYRKVEIEAKFPGGSSGWMQYLQKSLKYPDEAASKAIQGSVMVEFIVNTDGTLENIHVLSGPEALKAESIRVIRESGKWTPAKDQGKIVKSYHKQPIIYRLEPVDRRLP